MGGFAPPPHPQVNKPLNQGPAAPGPLLNTPQTLKTLKTIFIVMATAAYLLNARLYNTRGVYTRGVGNIAELRLAEYKLAENCHTRAAHFPFARRDQ